MANITDHLSRFASNDTQERAKRRLTDEALIPDPDTHVPKYQQLRVKQVRMTDDMIEDLYATARQLQDQRPDKSQENFTANTVARLCIAYTLEKIRREQVSRALRGSTEEELYEAFRKHLG